MDGQICHARRGGGFKSSKCVRPGTSNRLRHAAPGGFPRVPPLSPIILPAMHRLAVIALTLLVVFASVLPTVLARETNGERFKRGYPPLPPSRREVAKRQKPSAVPPKTYVNLTVSPLAPIMVGAISPLSSPRGPRSLASETDMYCRPSYQNCRRGS